MLLFISGFFVMCSCPGWYALAAGFSAIAVWLGSMRIRGWAIAVLIGSLIMTEVESYGELQEHRHRVERIERLKNLKNQK